MIRFRIFFSCNRVVSEDARKSFPIIHPITLSLISFVFNFFFALREYLILVITFYSPTLNG